MTTNIRVGTRVRLLGLPDWLTHDLPESEQDEMRGFIGQAAIVSEIDAHGYYWIGFGGTTDAEDGASYSGHSFGVPVEFLEPTA